MKKNIENLKIQEIPQSQLTYLWGGAGPGYATPGGTQVLGKGTAEETSYTYESDCKDDDSKQSYKCKWSDGVYHEYGSGISASGSTGFATKTSTAASAASAASKLGV